MDMEFMYFKTTRSTEDWKTWLRKVAERAKNTQKAMSTKLRVSSKIDFFDIPSLRLLRLKTTTCKMKPVAVNTYTAITGGKSLSIEKPCDPLEVFVTKVSFSSIAPLDNVIAIPRPKDFSPC